jgi:MscS family membrane protein
MKNFLQYSFLDNTLLDYLVVMGIVLLAVLVKRVLSKYIAGLLFRLMKTRTNTIDKKVFTQLVIAPLEVFLVVLITIIAFERLNFPSFLDVKIYKVSFQNMIEGLTIVILIISFIRLCIRIINFLALILEEKANLTDDQTDNQLVVFFKDFFKVLLVIIGIVLVLKFAFGYSVSSLITGLSLAGAAIALATRESIENLIASFIIFFDRPFSTGDLVKVHSFTGTVEKIGLRSTRIRTDQKTYVTVPNKQMVDSILDNLSQRTQRRSFTQIEILSDTSKSTIDQFITLLRGRIKETKEIENSTVMLADFQKNAFVVSVEFFTAPIPIDKFNNVREKIHLDIIELLESLNMHLKP